MRIGLYHGYELTGSGSNEYTRYLAAALARDGHAVCVIAGSSERAGAGQVTCTHERESVPGCDASLALVSAEGRMGFRATVVPLDPEDAPIVSKECREALGVSAGDRVSVTPLP